MPRRTCFLPIGALSLSDRGARVRLYLFWKGHVKLRIQSDALLRLLLILLVLLLHADAQSLGLLSTRQLFYHKNPVLHFWWLSVCCGWCSKLLPWPWLFMPWNDLSPAADKCGEIWKDESWRQASLWKTSSLNVNVIFLVVTSNFLVNFLFSGRDGNENYAFCKLMTNV